MFYYLLKTQRIRFTVHLECVPLPFLQTEEVPLNQGLILTDENVTLLRAPFVNVLSLQVPSIHIYFETQTKDEGKY